MDDILLTVTSAAWLCVINVLMTFYRQWALLWRDTMTSLPWTMHIHIILMQSIMILLAVLVFGQSRMSLHYHRRIGKWVSYVFIINAPFAMHLAWIMLQSRHWWHSLVQVTSLVISFAQLERVYRTARAKMILAHRHEVRCFIAVVNGAAGSRLLGNIFQYVLGFDTDTSYTLGLTTMFTTFLVPRIYAILTTDPCNEG